MKPGRSDTGGECCLAPQYALDRSGFWKEVSRFCLDSGGQDPRCEGTLITKIGGTERGRIFRLKNLKAPYPTRTWLASTLV